MSKVRWNGKKYLIPDHRGHDDDPISGHFDPAVYDMEQAGADRQHRAPGGARVFRRRILHFSASPVL